MKTTQAVRALAALAQDDRLKLYRLLVKAGPQGMPAGQLARSSRMPAPTVSFHLAKLVAADLAEFNPSFDRDGLTAKVVARLAARLARGA